MKDGIPFLGMGCVEKYWAVDWEQLGPGAIPFAIVTTGPNKVMFGGGSAIWEALMGRWSSGFWDSGSFIGVGNSGNAEDQTDNALHGTSQYLKGMAATYPLHTDGLATGNIEIKFRSLFTSPEANFHWREWAVFNSSMSRMLNRKAEDNGTKTSDMVWQFTVTLRLEC